MRVADAGPTQNGGSASVIISMELTAARPVCGPYEAVKKTIAARLFSAYVWFQGCTTGPSPMLSPLSFESTCSESMVFDRNDLRVLRLAFDEAVDMLHGSRSLDVLQRCRLAKLVIKSGWARNCRGLSLHGAETLIARDAVASMNKQAPLALCA